MSDLAAAAEAMGAPEELVERSAEARAVAIGSTTEAILTAWADSSAPAAAPAAETPPAANPEGGPEPTEEEVVEEAATPPAATPPDATPAISPQVVVAAAGAAVNPDAAPILTGRNDRAWTLLLSVTALFVFSIVFAVTLPAREGVLIAAEQVARIPFSSEALSGRDIYVREGCFYCHTQQVRSVVTDIGLGKVSEPGSSISFGSDNYGFQRIGPDLTHVGSREPTNDAEWLENFLTTPRTVSEDSLQPSYEYLSEADMTALIAYLLELE